MVGQLADEWLAAKADLRASTRALDDSVVETHVRPKWGTTPVAAIEHGDVQDWLAAKIDGGMSAGHARELANVLSGILGRALRDKRITANPALGLSLPSGPLERRVYLNGGRR
jgi:hypothetical protein